MRRIAAIVIGLCCICIVILISFFGCFDRNSSGTPVLNPVPDSILFTTAPVLTPGQALSAFQLEEGFRIELVASEPLIHDPVTMAFDAQGRIWVVEMQSYMQDLEGSGEEQSISRIVILEDEDSDGIMDRSKVFLDSLVMPRAIAVVNGGILYAEPPNLWFVENINDQPGEKTLIDTAYAVGGNAEHQANGLLRGLDNWYYNAKSKKRYRYRDNQWIGEETEFRGQWGITKDNYGRLFYNTNSNQLRGDFVPPNRMNRNPNFSPSLGINVEIAADQNVYPIRPNPGINRGYKEEMLDEQQKLKHFTAACSPLIYRGDNFPEAFFGNAFVCEPAGNLIKRNILYETGFQIKAEQAYADREFLASADERFRPVSLHNGPDGSLYVVDMYKGIIQHETYLTDYLREQIESRDLEKPLGYGRIYRIVYEGNWWERLISKFKDRPQPMLDRASDQELVGYLSHPNGWWRDNAQRLLVERDHKAIAPALMAVLQSDDDNHLGKLHALWTLEGMGIYNPEAIRIGVKSENPKVIATALRIGERNKNSKDAEAILKIYEQVIDHKSPIVQLQLALSLGEFMETDAIKVMDMLAAIALAHGEHALVREAIASSLQGKEEQFKTLIDEKSDGYHLMVAFLGDIISKVNLKRQLKNVSLTKVEKEQYIIGKSLFEKTCAGCHQKNGEGIVPIAPPLVGSEWVEGPEERLILIALHGLTGPVTVKGKVYQEPEVQPVMPGLKENTEFTDEKLAALLTYIRNAWGNEATAIDPATVTAVRKHSVDRTQPYTAKELME